MAAKTLGFVFALAVPLFLTRHLSQADFGLYKQIFLILNSAVVILPLGFHMSAFYFLSREPQHRNRIVLNILLFNTVTGSLGCLALILFPNLPGVLFHSQAASTYSPYLGVMILFWVISSFLEWVAVANLETRVSTVLIVFAQLSKTTLLLTAAVFFSSVRALVYAAIIQGALQTVILLIYLRVRFPQFWRGFEWTFLREQLSYALPFGFSAVIQVFQNDFHNYVVANRFSADMFAIYSIGCFQLPLIGILTESVGSVLIPTISALEKRREYHEIVRLTADAMRRLAFVFFPVYCFLLATGPDFITFLFTQRYRQSWPVFAVNLTLLPLYAFILDPLTRAYADQRHYLLRLYAGLFVVQAVCILPAIRQFGLVGAISVVILANVLGRIIIARKMASVLQLKRQDLRMFGDLIKIAVAATAGGAAAWVLRQSLEQLRPVLILLYSGILFCLVYGASIGLLRILNAGEIDFIMRQLRRISGRPPQLAVTSGQSDQ